MNVCIRADFVPEIGGTRLGVVDLNDSGPVVWLKGYRLIVAHAMMRT
jgi:hypothetical protein